MDEFHVNEPIDEDGNPMYDCESDKHRYKQGMDGSHLITTFQCDLCIFRNLFKREPREVELDKENLKVIRRMNLDSIWAREPSTTYQNMLSLVKLVVTCESHGFDPDLPKLGPFPVKDVMGQCVAFSMLIQSRRPGNTHQDVHSVRHHQETKKRFQQRVLGIHGSRERRSRDFFRNPDNGSNHIMSDKLNVVQQMVNWL